LKQYKPHFLPLLLLVLVLLVLGLLLLLLVLPLLPAYLQVHPHLHSPKPSLNF